jgi:hypothetical protein
MRVWRLSNRHRRIRSDEAFHAFGNRASRMMKTVTGRINKLETRLGIAPGKPGLLFVASAAAWRHPLNVEACMDVLSECGFVYTGSGVGLVNLLHLPEGLNAKDLERFLREHGPEICGPRVRQFTDRQRPPVFAGTTPQDDPPKPVSPVGAARRTEDTFGRSTRDHLDVRECGWFATWRRVSNKRSVAGRRVAKNAV